MDASMARGDRLLASGHGPTGSQPAAGATFSAWTAIAGAIGGAIVVGAIWGVTSVTQAAANTTVASVNGKTITRATLEKALFSRYGKQTLQQMIDNRLVADAAKDQHLTASAAAMQSAQAQIESAYGITTSAALSSFLQSNGLTQAQFQTILKNQVLEQELAVSGIKVTNAEIAAYYKAHKASFAAKGAKTPLPLSQVKSQVVTAIRQSQAVPATTLLADLAKKYRLTISDHRFKSLVAAIESTAAPAGG